MRYFSSKTAALASLVLAGCFGPPREPERIPMAHGILGAYETRQDGVDEVWIDGELVGYSEALRVFDLEGKAYVRREVLDEHGQAIGFMDHQGQVFRYSIFGEPEHLTTDGHARAVSALFDRRGGEVRFQNATAKTSAR
ncbi:MAG: hypothetical protein JNM84_24150 [Planctomycetes bacterium]|nr:hypothetical protein [Planctomycetota bacterium]